MSSKKSPLERLVDIQQKEKFLLSKDGAHSQKPKIITPLIEIPLAIDDSDGSSEQKTLLINNSSLVMNFNLNVDSDLMDKALEKSAQVAKGIAAAGAAVLGTAFLMGPNKKPGKVKAPKVKKPTIKKENYEKDNI